MDVIDLARLTAEKQNVERYLEDVLSYAETDPVRAFSAAEDARKHMSAVYTAVHHEYLKTVRRVW